MKWPPHVTVGSVVERDGKFLVVEEMLLDKYVLNLPAGHLEPHETLIEAAIRETYEETGWHTTIASVLSINKSVAEKTGIPYLHICFVGHAVSFDPSAKLDTGIRQALWLDYNELVSLQHTMRSDTVLNNIQQFIRGETFPLSMIYDDGK